MSPRWLFAHREGQSTDCWGPWAVFVLWTNTSPRWWRWLLFNTRKKFIGVKCKNTKAPSPSLRMRNDPQMRRQTWNGWRDGTTLLGTGSSVGSLLRPGQAAELPLSAEVSLRTIRSRWRRWHLAFARAPLLSMNGRLAASSTLELVPQHSLVEAQALLQSLSCRAACPSSLRRGVQFVSINKQCPFEAAALDEPSTLNWSTAEVIEHPPPNSHTLPGSVSVFLLGAQRRPVFVKNHLSVRFNVAPFTQLSFPNPINCEACHKGIQTLNPSLAWGLWKYSGGARQQLLLHRSCQRWVVSAGYKPAWTHAVGDATGSITGFLFSYLTDNAEETRHND